MCKMSSLEFTNLPKINWSAKIESSGFSLSNNDNSLWLTGTRNIKEERFIDEIKELDLVPDTSAKQFIYSFRRFIARRGCPNEMLSDNGTAFSAEETQTFAAKNKIKWHFSIAEAPWFGGFWERLVQVTKRCLKNVIGQAHLTYIEMQTVLLQIELVLNSRPLCELYDNDYEDPTIYYSVGNYHNATYEGISNNYINGKQRVRYIETIDHFWHRWRKEYCVSLRNFQRVYRKKNNLIPMENDVVIIYEDKVP